MHSVAVVILNWNGIDDTVECLSGLENQTYRNFDIIVVDNASEDSSVTTLESLENITLLKNSANKGFAGGVNTGIRYALDKNYTYVALLNNDATPDDNWLGNLVATSEMHSDTAIITGLLLSKDGSNIDSTSEQYSCWGVAFPQSRGLPSSKAPSSGYVFGATGGASLYKTSLFKNIGLFDETFFAYYEDVDISFRAQLAGYTVYYTRDAIAYHKKGASSKKIPGFTVYQMFKNLPLLLWKNVPFKLIVRVAPRFYVLYTLMFANAIKNKNIRSATKGVFASLWFFWTSSIWLRHGIQSKRKVDNRYIWSIFYKDLPPEQSGMRKLRKIITGK